MTIKNSPDKPESYSRDILLEDYRYLTDSFWKNEQTGETRVNLFTGFVTLVGGALVGLVTSDSTGLSGRMLQPVVLFSLAGLLAMGAITLQRILTRNEKTDSIKQGLDSIRQIFKDHFDGENVLGGYYPFGGPVVSIGEGESGAVKKPLLRRRPGGLAHHVAVINSIIAASIAGTVLVPVHAPSSFLSGVYAGSAAFFIFSLVLQYYYISRREKNRLNVHGNGITHAGGVVYRIDKGRINLLLVKSRDSSDEWVLPKGHIMPGEGHGEAALREVREETGIAAKIKCMIDTVRYNVKGEEVAVKFYLMEYMYETKAQEDRGKSWFTLERALKTVSFSESKYILGRAVAKLGEQAV